MKRKVELVLDELIKNFIKIREPISSSLLKELAQLDISPSTIRNYFQMLEKIGMVEKEHISSGSIPSVRAMEFFWKKEFPMEFQSNNVKKLDKACQEYGTLAFIKIFENQMLDEVYNVQNKFIILEFDNDETVVRFQPEIFDFLKSFRKMYVKDLNILFKHYNLDYLSKKIKNFYKEMTLNENLLYNKFNYFDINDLSHIVNMRIDYQNKTLIKKFKINDSSKEIEIFLIGDVYTDFMSLFNSMKGGNNE